MDGRKKCFKGTLERFFKVTQSFTLFSEIQILENVLQFIIISMLNSRMIGYQISLSISRDTDYCSPNEIWKNSNFKSSYNDVFTDNIECKFFKNNLVIYFLIKNINYFSYLKKNQVFEKKFMNQFSSNNWVLLWNNFSSFAQFTNL